MFDTPDWRDGSAVAQRYQRLSGRLGELRRAGEHILMEARSQGRETLNEGETRRFAEVQRDIAAIEGDGAEAEMDYRRMGARPALPYDNEGSTAMTTRHDNFDLTYRRGVGRPSWLKDMIHAALGTDNSGESRGRLMSHARDVAEHGAFQEFRDLSRVDGSGGYGVPPAWLMNQHIELARPGRAIANVVQRQAFPGGTDSPNVPKILTGTTVAVQTADNTPVSDTDLTDTFINAPVRTIAGHQGLAIQLIDQSPIAFDDIVFRDLVAAHAAVTDVQVIGGAGTNGEVLGIRNTPNTQHNCGIHARPSRHLQRDCQQYPNNPQHTIFAARRHCHAPKAVGLVHLVAGRQPAAAVFTHRQRLDERGRCCRSRRLPAGRRTDPRFAGNHRPEHTS
jgi:HK97 family phage major capsid protein